MAIGRPVRRLSILAGLGVTLAAGVVAQPAGTQEATAVYRCGNSYQAEPCPGAVAVDAADPRSAAQQRQAQAVAQRDQAEARRLAAERRAAEREARRHGGAANLGPRAAAAPAKPASAPAKAQRKKVKLKSGKAAQAAKSGQGVRPP